MPVHDWKPGFSWLFHDFHQEWVRAIKHALNSGLLPPDYFAMAEQVTVGVTPDVIALRDRAANDPGTGGGLLVVEPKTQIVATLGAPRKKNHVAIKHAGHNRTVAVIEIVSPGNKDSRGALRSFLDKTVDLLAKGIHLLVIDVHPPTKRDPHGIHAAIRDEVGGDEFAPPHDRPLTLASYEAAVPPKAYVEPVAVGDVLPDMPLFLVPGGHVLVPLEATYRAAWEGVPIQARREMGAG